MAPVSKTPAMTTPLPRNQKGQLALNDPAAISIAARLTPARREALALIGDRPLYRVVGGWKVPGGRKILLGTVSELKADRLIRDATRGMAPTLTLTELGRRVTAAIREKAK